LSRSFRALKTWFTFQVFGADKIGACIEKTCRVAQDLGSLIEKSETFELYAPVGLNIVCFGLKEPADPDLNNKIVIDLQENGIAAPSSTILAGRPAIRAAIFNHRTTEEDMRLFYEALCKSQRRISATAV